MNDSIYIILNQYKKENITEEEAIQLIKGIYENKNTYIPVFRSWPQIIYEQPQYNVNNENN